MAKAIRTLIIDLEISDDGSYEPGETPPVHGHGELLKILQAGAGATFSVVEVSSNSLMSRSYAEKIYEVAQL